jgi:hypothetical protein
MKLTVFENSDQISSKIKEFISTVTEKYGEIRGVDDPEGKLTDIIKRMSVAFKIEPKIEINAKKDFNLCFIFKNKILITHLKFEVRGTSLKAANGKEMISLIFDSKTQINGDIMVTLPFFGYVYLGSCGGWLMNNENRLSSEIKIIDDFSKWYFDVCLENGLKTVRLDVIGDVNFTSNGITKLVPSLGAFEFKRTNERDKVVRKDVYKKSMKIMVAQIDNT